jgi:hypothetical protein
MKVGAVKTECAEIVKPTLCLVMVGDTINHQSSNQRRVKRRSEPILLGRFDGSAFKLVVLNQLVVEENTKRFLPGQNFTSWSEKPTQELPQSTYIRP